MEQWVCNKIKFRSFTGIDPGTNNAAVWISINRTTAVRADLGMGVQGAPILLNQTSLSNKKKSVCTLVSIS